MSNSLLSIDEIEKFSEKSGVDFNELVQIARAKSQDDFISILYKDIEKIIRIIEEDPNARANDKEDRITQDVVLGLTMRGYTASHDTFHGGHCDIVVKLKNYTWLGEAKIHHNSYDHLMQGFNQLFTRYSSGTDFCNQGGVIIYCRNKDTLSVLNNWKENLKMHYGNDCISSEKCIERPSLSFYSKHIHESSGLNFLVKHIFVVLHFDPKDLRH